MFDIILLPAQQKTVIAYKYFRFLLHLPSPLVIRGNYKENQTTTRVRNKTKKKPLSSVFHQSMFSGWKDPFTDGKRKFKKKKTHAHTS